MAVAYALQDDRDGTGVASGPAYELTQVASVRSDVEHGAMDSLLGFHLNCVGIVHQGSDDEREDAIGFKFSVVGHAPWSHPNTQAAGIFLAPKKPHGANLGLGARAAQPVKGPSAAGGG